MIAKKQVIAKKKKGGGGAAPVPPLRPNLNPALRMIQSWENLVTDESDFIGHRSTRAERISHNRYFHRFKQGIWYSSPWYIFEKNIHEWCQRKKNLIWFNSYLTSRKQFIKYSNQNNNLKVCFLHCFFHICKWFKKSSQLLDPIKLDDDTNLFYTYKNIKVFLETVSKELYYVKVWFIANKLSFNAGKTKYLLFYKQNACDSIPLKLPTINFNIIKIKREHWISWSNNRRKHYLE